MGGALHFRLDVLVVCTCNNCDSIRWARSSLLVIVVAGEVAYIFLGHSTRRYTQSKW